MSTKVLGERVHPSTGRTMVYVACDICEGEARVNDGDELTDSVWADSNSLRSYVPYGLYPAVQEYLDGTLNCRRNGSLGTYRGTAPSC
jgi:8-oxo-dGTP diphosphatase